MLRRSFKATVFLFFLGTALVATAQDNAAYQEPPKAIKDLVLSRPTPGVSINKNAEWMLLLDRSDFPDIAELAEPELRIAGQRINPANFGPSRAGSSTNIQIKNIKTNKVYDIEGLPANLRASSVQWSPAEDQFAFVHSGEKEIDLYVVKLSDRKAVKINKAPLNIVLGNSYQWAGNNRLVYKTIVPGHQLTAKPAAPSGPIVQENLGRAAASRTYQDLIKNPYDEALFEYYATSQLAINDLQS